MVEKQEIIEKIAEALDDIEGDFTQKTLRECLEICKKYPYVCDKEINDGHWRRLIKGDL